MHEFRCSVTVMTAASKTRRLALLRRLALIVESLFRAAADTVVYIIAFEIMIQRQDSHSCLIPN